MSKSDRRPRLVGAIATVLLTAAVAPAPAAAPALPPYCRDVVVSPAFRTDRTLFCVHQDSDGYHVLSVSRNAGGSWRRAAMSGLLRPAGPARAMTLAVSPSFGADQTLFAATAAGISVSTDAGETFTALDTLTQGTRDRNPVAFVGTGPALPVVGDGRPRLLLAYAGPPMPALIEPGARTRRPALGVPGSGAVVFVVPSAAAAPAGALAVVNDRATQVTPSAGSVRLFRCDAALTCAEPLFAFPAGTYFGGDSRLLLHPDGSLVALVSDGTGVQPWRSTDGGKTFAIWESVARLLTAATLDKTLPPRVTFATTSAAPRRVYVRIEAVMPRTGWPKNAPPASQIFRSDDAGSTWRRIAWARTFPQPGPRGNAPWTSSGTMLQVTPDGRLFADGGTERLDTTWCSLDGGKRWYAGCMR